MAPWVTPFHCWRNISITLIDNRRVPRGCGTWSSLEPETWHLRPDLFVPQRFNRIEP